jgi:hypothetical protein
MIGYLMDMTKYKHRIDTLDGPIEYEDESPPLPRRTPEEIEEERVRLYPSEEIASYLLYTCSYCQDQYYPIHPDRGENMNPYLGGYMLESKDNRLRPICHRCVLHLSWRDENFRLK